MQNRIDTGKLGITDYRTTVSQQQTFDFQHATKRALVLNTLD